jgi:hypothetical protein
MAWTFSVNNFAGSWAAGGGGFAAIEVLKTVLKAAGWTIRMSRGYVPSPPAFIPYFVDNATGDYVDIDPLAGFNQYCYFVAQQPVAVGHPRREFLFVGGLVAAVNVFVSTVGGYVWRPVDFGNQPADEKQIAGAACSTHGVDLFPDNTFPGPNQTFWYHAGADLSAPWGWYLRWTMVSDSVPRGIVFDPLAAGSFPAADQDPAIYNCSEDSTYGSPFTTALFASGSASLKYWFCKGLAGETWCSYFENWPGPTGFALFYGMGAYGVGIPTNVGPNPNSSDYEHFPIAWGRSASFGLATGWKGIGTVQRWKGGSLANFDTLSVAGVRERVVVESVTLPWPNVAPSL